MNSSGSYTCCSATPGCIYVAGHLGACAVATSGDPGTVDRRQMAFDPSVVPPPPPPKRTGPFSLEFSPCVTCDAYRPCVEQAAHGWGLCAIHTEFVRGNGCCGQWQAGV